MTTAGFRPRRTEPLGVWRCRGWQLKRYSISADGRPPDDEILHAAEDTLERTLPDADVTPAVGFVVIHKGEEAVWLLADMWRADILYQQLYRAPLIDPASFTSVPPGGPTACVWELAVHSHERDSLVEHVLARPQQPDTAAYLADTIFIDAASA